MMGDRGNVIFEGPEGDCITFYSHWTGSSLIKDCANILANNPGVRSRLESGDYYYGFRGIIHGLLLRVSPDGVKTTGSGIAPGWDLCDGDVKLIFTFDGRVKINERSFTVDEFISRESTVDTAD